MTIAEVERRIESRKRVDKIQEKNKASFDYILADLIGRSIARVYNSSNTMPKINEVYSSIFDAEEIEEAVADKKAELSALRFKLFAQSYNTRFKGASKK
jgi:uncharacterized membrane-anchored protein YjiN (DUF445 family)